MTPRQRRMIRAATRRSPADPSEVEGELNIVPLLDIVVNLMLFLLATTTATMALAETDISVPDTCVGCRGRASMQLSVTLADGGIIVASNAGQLAPGCDAVGGGPGLTIPRAGGRYDFAALASCLERVHAQYPEEREMILSADPQVPYEAVIRALDAIRPSFTETRLSAGVR